MDFVNSVPRFRWGFTAYDDAKRFKHETVAALLLDNMKKNPPINGTFEMEDIQVKMKNLLGGD